MKTNILKTLRQIIRQGSGISADFANIRNEIHETKMLIARFLINQMKSQGMYGNVQDAEFKVFSQFGDDGIIQYLVHHLKIETKTFIEFGVENYTESNTRFLLMNNNWKGLVIDGSKENVDYIKNDNIYWKYDLTAVCAFVDRENINKIFLENNFSGEIGLLSIDIDGNDYWVWDAINVINPAIVIVEYNSLFGPKAKVSTPYDAAFQRTKAHYSNLYFGASLAALCSLAEHKGYAFVGSNSAGCNAFFVKRKLIISVPIVLPEKGYVPISARQSRNKNGALNYLSFQSSQNLIQTMPVFDFENGEISLFNDVLNRITSDG